MAIRASAAELGTLVDAVEDELRETDEACLEAEQRWSVTLRRCEHGQAGPDAVAAAQQRWLELRSRRRVEAERLERLRLELYEQRHRELVAGSLADIITDHDAAWKAARSRLSSNGRTSLVGRLFHRGEHNGHNGH